MARKRKTTKCHVCERHIDRGDCQNKFTIITDIDNQPIPRREERFYLCSLCRIGFLSQVGTAKLEALGNRKS